MIAENFSFESIYHEYYRKMVIFVSTFHRVPRSDREDLAHDILVHAYLKLSRYDPQRSFSVWLYALARNYTIDYIRTCKDEHVSFDETLCVSGTDVETGTGDISERVLEEMRKMTEKDQQIALFVLFENKSCAETGRILSIPGATVRWRLMEIRKRLRWVLKEVQ